MTDDEALALYLELYGTQWSPHTPSIKQAQFLQLTCLEALFGGAAGGGKSDALLMAAVQYVDVPQYAALILRRTYKDLALPGAIMDRAADWLRPTAARWDEDNKTWRFPSGATLTFGYIETEKDKYRYQSSEFQFIGWDELTQFPETQYRYMLSRLRRRAGADVPLRSRGATNPGGVGHKWVKTRFVDKDTSTGRVFVPAKLDDNEHIDRAAYEEALEQLDDITRKQLRDGLWVQDAQGLVYTFDAERNLTSSLPKRGDWRYIWVADYGASQRSPTTAIGVVAFSPALRKVYVAEVSKHAGMTTSSMAERFRADRLVYGGFVKVLGDQGGLGAGYNLELRERHSIPIENVEKANKLGYRKLLNSDLQHGALLVVEPTCSDWIDEVNDLMWNDKGTDSVDGQPDHATDMVLYGWREAKHFLATEEDPEPPKDTPERDEYDARRMFEAARNQAATAQKKKTAPFWDKNKR